MPRPTPVVDPLFAIGLVVFLVSATAVGLGPGGSKFMADEGTRLWHLLLAVQPAIWFATLALVWRDLRGSHSALAPGGARVLWFTFGPAAIVFLLAAVPAVFAYFSDGQIVDCGAKACGDPSCKSRDVAQVFQEATGLPAEGQKILVISVIGAFVASVHALGMLRVGAAALALRDDSLNAEGSAGTGEQTLARAGRYSKLNDLLQRFLSCGGAIVGAAMLSTGALRNLVNGAHMGCPPFPASAALAYGLYFTILLAALYLPARRMLDKVGSELVDKLAGPPPEIGGQWKAWRDGKQAIEAELGVGRGLDSLQSSLSILYPILAALSTLLVADK